jgi:hypothetical protein
MPRYKAVPLVLLRNRVREAGAEPAVVSALSESDRTTYERFVATDWVDQAFADRLYGVATPLVYGGGRMALRRFGQEAARADLGGVYRVVLRFVTVPALIDRAATLWSKYHDTGSARAEQPGERAMRLVVEGHPELGENVRESAAGWLAGAVELSGASNVRVTHEGDPTQWLWIVTWR